MSYKRTLHNILVTGGAGFIGSAFIRYTLQKVPHFNGICLNLDALTYASDLKNLSEVENDPRYIFHQGNICQQGLVEHLCFENQIDTIIHFAAESHVDRSIESPHPFLETNVMGTFHLLEVVRKNPKIHFHHVSTDEVYGSLGLQQGAFSENSPYNPQSPYAASKASSDHLVRAYANTYSLSTCISHCSNNYGPFQHHEKLLPKIITNCFNGERIPIYGDGTNVRDWLYVEDHIEALWMLLERGLSGHTYNIAGSCERRNLDIVEEIIQHLCPQMELEKLITFVKDRPGHDFRYALECTKIKEEIGWSPKHDLTAGLKKTIEWYVNRHHHSHAQ